MAFSLNVFQCWGEKVSVPVSFPGFQYAYFEIAGTSSDVALDFSNFSGTLWAALDNTQGGLSALQAMQAIQAQVSSLISVQSQQVKENRVKVASLTTTGQYTETVTSNMPVIAVNASDGETLWQILMVWGLSAYNAGVTVDIPSAS